MIYYEQKKYEKILFDFSNNNINKVDTIDNKIQNNIDLIDLDESFRESYLDII